MISDFEQSLANALGSQLAPPFQGRVQVAPGTAGGNQPRIVLGVSRTTPLEPDFVSIRTEIVPGATEPRRVLRLRCEVRLEVIAGGGQGRAQQLQGLQAALFALDAPEFRQGAAITNGNDPGFLVHNLKIGESFAPLAPGTGEDAVFLTLTVEGLFWVIGTPGEAGVAIVEVRVRGGVFPMELVPSPPIFAPGAGAFSFSLIFRTLPDLRLSQSETPLPALPFGRLALRLVGAGGQAGAGTLGGGAVGATPEIRRILLNDDKVNFTYTPPAQPAQDILVVSFEDNDNGIGTELGRFTFVTK